MLPQVVRSARLKKVAKVMAIYHLSLKVVQRSKGRSATAAAAYRTRSKITDERTGQVYDYARKKGVEARALFTPDRSKISREELWNLAEAAEHRKDGITAREYELALPAELDKKGREKLAANFCQMLVRRYGVAVDVALHVPTKDGDQRNYHAHVLTTTRRFEGGRLHEKSDFELSARDRQKKGLKTQKEDLEAIRKEWAEMVNTALAEAGRPERVSHKRLEAQGITRPATVHLGVAATAMERKGIQTDRGDLNRWPVVRKMYVELKAMKKNLRDLEADLARMQENGGQNGRRICQRPETNAGGNAGMAQEAKRGNATGSAEARRSDGSVAAQRTNAGSRKTVQRDQFPVERPGQVAGRAGKSERGYQEFGREAGRNFGEPAKNLRDTGRVFGKGQAGSVPGGQRRGGEAGRDGRADRDDLGSSGKFGKARWLKRLRELEEALIQRIKEYRTIGDLLAMNEKPEFEEKSESRQIAGPK